MPDAEFRRYQPHKAPGETFTEHATTRDLRLREHQRDHLAGIDDRAVDVAATFGDRG
jgi:hypothetical protein